MASSAVVGLAILFLISSVILLSSINSLDNIRSVNLGNCTKNDTGSWNVGCPLSNVDAQQIQNSGYAFGPLYSISAYLGYFLIAASLISALFLLRRRR